MTSTTNSKARIADSLRLLGEISRLVAQVSEENLPDVIARILEGVRAVSGLSRGRVALFDYVFDELHVLEVDGNTTRPAIRRRVSDGLQSDLLGRELPLADTDNHSPIRLEILVSQPVVAGSRKFGEMYIVSPEGRVTIGRNEDDLLAGLASLAAIALERRVRLRDSIRVREWLGSFSKILTASRVPSVVSDVDSLLQVIAEEALKTFLADFVILYEYFEERGDVRLPPTLAGPILHQEALRDRDNMVKHRPTAVFRLLELQHPLYAEDPAYDWVKAGLSDHAVGEDPLLNRETIAASVGIPLRIDRERVGVLFVNYRRDFSFFPEFRERLELFANQAALAIGNARFFMRSERYSRELEALNQIGREFGSAVTRDIEQIGRLIDEKTLQVIPARNFFLCVFDAEADHFTLPYIRNEYDTRHAIEPELSQGLTGYVCRTGKPLLAIREMQQQLFAAGSATLVGHPAAVWLGAPLIVRERVIGALVLQDYEDETAFNREHLNLLQAIASQAAIAIDNYRLLHDANLRLGELSALLELSQALGSRRLSWTQPLSSLLDHLCRLANADGGILFLIDPGDRRRLKIAAASDGLQRYLGRAILLGEGVSGRVAAKGEPMIVNEYGDWSGKARLFDPPAQRVCAVPLIWQDQIIGVTALSAGRQAGQFSQREIEILQRFAGPLAIAVQNAREASFRDTLINAGPSAIIAADATGRITELNDEAAKLFNFSSREELLARSVADLYWGGLPEASKVQSLLRSEDKVREVEIFGRSGTGEKIPISLAAALLRDENGAVIGSVGILEDMRLQSLRGRTALLVEALREISDEEDLDRIIERVVDSAVTLLFADAGCLFLHEGDTFALKYWLPRNVADVEALRSRAYDRLRDLASADPRQIVFLAEEGREGGVQILPDSSSSVLVPIRTESRLLAFLLIESRQSSHFSADQELLEVLASQAAVSINRVQLIRYREKTQEKLLVSANAILVGQLTVTFMHEAKNSLNGLNLAVQNLLEDIEREPDLKAKKDYLDRLAAVQTEIARFGELSRRLQRFTQYGLRPEKKDVYLNEVVTHALQLLGSTLRSKGMKYEARLDPSLERPSKGKGHPVQMDEYQIQQVLMNLILNAIEASPEHRPLLVETRNEPEHIEIRVADYGSGIPQGFRRKLFQPFATTKKDGVGLGLYLSRILIEENHHGSIEILSSTPGKGSVFSVRLPKAG